MVLGNLSIMVLQYCLRLTLGYFWKFYQPQWENLFRRDDSNMNIHHWCDELNCTRAKNSSVLCCWASTQWDCCSDMSSSWSCQKAGEFWQAQGGNSIFLLNRLQMDDWHTYTYCVAWWHQIWGRGSSWGAKRVLRCTTLKVLNEFYDVPRSKLWRLKFCNKIYVWVHDQ